jgi:molecular chaperone DnaK
MSTARYDRMAIDFGTSNTIVAFWNEKTKDVDLHTVPDVTRGFRFQLDGQSQEIPVIPSLICYETLQKSYIGNQVIQRMVEEQQGSFRWIKSFIKKSRSIRKRLPDGNNIDHRQAGRDFLERVLLYATESGQIDLRSCEVAVTAPVEAFADYTDWLSNTCREIGVRRFRIIDESSACIFGYEAKLQPGDIFLIFDFGGGTLDVSIVRMETEVKDGLGCTVVGKAGGDIGGSKIDGWVYDSLLKRANLDVLDARKASALFLQGVEQIKERLTYKDVTEYDMRDANSGLRLAGTFWRKELEELFEDRDLAAKINETLDQALKDADKNERVGESDIKEVLLVGGSSLIPYVREQVTSRFGNRTKTYRPFDAVARGACRFLSSDVESLYDYIQHTYAIKNYPPTRPPVILVPSGTKYPTKKGFKQVALEASRNGQRIFRIDIFEIADRRHHSAECDEMVYGPDESPILDAAPRSWIDDAFHLNEHNPIFIEADPPAVRGDNRFSVSFRVERDKHLHITVWDNQTRKLLYDDQPVVKL